MFKKCTLIKLDINNEIVLELANDEIFTRNKQFLITLVMQVLFIAGPFPRTMFGRDLASRIATEYQTEHNIKQQCVGFLTLLWLDVYLYLLKVS